MSATRSSIDLEISRRFDVLKLLLMIFVIMIHAEKWTLAYVENMPNLLRLIILFLEYNLTRVAVPLFFAISGYLLFTGYDPSLSGYLTLLRKKFRTIAIPFIVFNALCMLIILVFQKIPYMGNIQSLEERGFVAVFVGYGGYPVNYTLWFLRDLMIYLLVSPLFYVMARRIPYLGLAVWYLLWNYAQRQGFPIELSGAFFFYLGGVLSVREVPIGGKTPFLVPAAIVFVAFMLIGVYLEDKSELAVLCSQVHRFILILGVYVFWGLSAFPSVRDNRKLLSLAGFSFFIYLVHEPILSYCVYGSRFFFDLLGPQGVLNPLFYLFLVTGVTFGLALNLGRLVLRFAPRLYAAVTGARSPCAVHVK